MSQPETHEFQAEVKQLLDLVVHSLYSDRDIFLRELVSNASDAIDKRRFEALTHTELGGEGEPQITLVTNAEAHTLSISDTGIGMTRAEVVTNIGTIAKSGTKEFLKRAGSGEVKLPELIGQFGVGFYSAFMVADRIELVTRKAGEATATRWISTGDGSYTIEDATRDDIGTTVTLHLKAADPDEGTDYTNASTLRRIVKHYSDFVAYPIKLGDDTLNSMKAIWDRPKSEVTEDEYKQFYRHIAHDWTDPLRTIPVKMEGTIEAYALLYLPAKAPMDLYNPEMKRGLQLYVKRVFVMDECKDLMPPYLRFVRGVVDAHDLSLNVSREILQKDRQIAVIRKQLVKKVLGTLEELARDDADKYKAFWSELGPVVKEGLLAPDAATEKDKLLELVLSPSTTQASTSIAAYIERMKEGQEAIYFLSGASREAVAKSPLLEAFVAKGFEVLLFSDPIDELWLERAPEFRGKPMHSIGRGDIKLDGDETVDKAKAAEFGDLLSCLRVHLQEEIKEVRLSQRLTTSPVVLVADENDLSPRVAKMLEQMGQAPPKQKRILEVNPNHPLIAKLQAIFLASNADPRLEQCAKLLLGQAHLVESGTVPDQAAFAATLIDIMLRAT